MTRKLTSGQLKWRKNAPPKYITPEMRFDIYNRFCAGETMTAIAKYYKCSTSTIHRAVKKETPK